MEITLFENQFLLLKEKAIFWVQSQTLIIADLHLGKATHFRKQGIALSANGLFKDYEKLNTLIVEYLPKRIIILGDLFHSNINSEWLFFENFVKQNQTIEWILIEGNHDIINPLYYHQIGLKVYANYNEKEFHFSHFPILKPDGNTITFAGHLHPGYTLIGKGKQKINLPCFYLHNHNLVLPAFGTLTGLSIVNKKNAKIYILSQQKVIEIA